MRRKTKYSIFLFIFILISLGKSAWAENITLETLLPMAVSTNKTLKASEHRLKKTIHSAHADVSTSRLQATLNGSYYGNKNYIKGIIPKTGEQVGFTILQPLDISGYHSIQDKIARVKIESERINYLTNLNNILPSVAQLYVQSIWAKDSIKSLYEILASREENYKATEAMFNKQVVGKLDYMRAKTNVEQIKAQIKDYEIQYTTYIEGVASLLDGKKVKSNESLVDLADIYKGNESDKITNPELESLLFAKKASKLKRNSAALGHAPTLDVRIDYTPLRSDRAKSDYDELTGGLYLSIPIFNGGRTRNTVRSYREEVKELENLYSAKELELIADVKAYTKHLATYKEQVKIWKKEKENATQKMDIANELYSSGMISQTDLLNVMDEQQSAEMNYLSALLNKKITEINLLKTDGSFLKLSQKYFVK